MPLRRVDRAISKPNHCAVLPQLGQSHEKGYWDTGNELPGFDNRIYVSVVAIEDLARREGWSSPEDHSALLDELERQGETIARLERESDELKEKFGAIDVLASAGFVARKKAGRPPAKPKPEEVAA